MKNATTVVSSLLLALGFLLEMKAPAAAAAQVAGTIKVVGAKTQSVPPFTALECGDLEVVASSKATIPPPKGHKGPWPGLVPLWQRHAKATGNWTSGSCDYAVTVVPGSEFNVVVTDTNTPCGGFDYVTTTPPEAGWFKVSSGNTKDQNFTVDLITCYPPPM